MSIVRELSEFIVPKSKKTYPFDKPKEAYEMLCKLYDAEVERIRVAYKRFKELNDHEGYQNIEVLGHYPLLTINVDEEQLNLDPSLSHGAFKEEGVYQMAVTNPRQYHDLLGQFEILKRNNANVKFEIGLSEQAIPLHYAMADLSFDIDTDLECPEKLKVARKIFTKRDPQQDYDYAANKHQPPEGVRMLYGYGPSRVDHAIDKFFYYTRTSWESLQPFVCFSNYGAYINGVYDYGCQELKKEFNASANNLNESSVIAVIRSGHSVLVREGYENHQSLLKIRKEVEGGSVKGEQIPACHILTADGLGFSMINPGVGDPNSRNIATLIASKRSHSWIMAGHCAGLDVTMSIGDYVSASAYYKNLENDKLVPVMCAPSSEIQRSISDVLDRLTERDSSFDRYQNHRYAPVSSTNDRNWENNPAFIKALENTFSAALEMETAFLAEVARTNAIPFASFLRVSDIPLFDKPKSASGADKFFGELSQHMGVLVEAWQVCKESHMPKLHSRQFRPVRGAYVLQ